MTTKSDAETRFSILMPRALRETVNEIAVKEKRSANAQLNYYIELGMKAEKEGMRLLDVAS